MARNVELLTKVRDLITAEPKKLDMGSWATADPELVEFEKGRAKIECGTTSCIAGWAAQLSGDKFLIRADDRDFDDDDDTIYYASSVIAKNGRVIEVGRRAMHLLGLTEEESDLLFLDTNNEQAVEALDLLINGATIKQLQLLVYGEELSDDDQ